MRIEIDQEKKLAAFWLTRQERDDQGLQDRLKQSYDAYRKEGYAIVVYYSGAGSLLEHTTNLLLSNRKAASE